MSNVNDLMHSRAFAERVNALVTGAHADMLAGAHGEGAPFAHAWFAEVEAMTPEEAQAAMVQLLALVAALVHANAYLTDRDDAGLLQTMALSNLQSAEGP